MKHSRLCPTRKQHPNMRGVSKYQKGAYMYHFFGFGFKSRAEDENIRTTRWRECSTEAIALSQSAFVFSGRLSRTRRFKRGTRSFVLLELHLAKRKVVSVREKGIRKYTCQGSFDSATLNLSPANSCHSYFA